ncbi:MAG TPA: hypothetical protein VMU29_08655 [Smithella sp.]|nr:hypothetical protein [Smithella sp.]
MKRLLYIVASIMIFLFINNTALSQASSTGGLATLIPEKNNRNFVVPLNEPINKQSKRLWKDLSYTEADVNTKTLKGLLWMIKYMNTDNHLKGNENNYLTMLGTMYCSSNDPCLKRIAREEAKIIVNGLIKADYFNNVQDADELIEYLTLLNHLDIKDKKIEARVFLKLGEEKEKIINKVQKLKSIKVDGDQLYDVMLMMYYITNLKKNFPHNEVLKGMPDLNDFFEILARYKYHMEDIKNPDYSKLTSDDIDDIADDLYNITHVIFVVCDYNYYKVPKRYFQRELDYIHKYSGLICSKYHNDPDLLTEVVYVLSAMGYPKNYKAIKDGWTKMLCSQKQDGSWEAFGTDEDETAIDKNYDIFHATWVAVDMITEPAVMGTAPFYKSLKPSLKKYASYYREKMKEAKLNKLVKK